LHEDHSPEIQLGANLFFCVCEKPGFRAPAHGNHAAKATSYLRIWPHNLEFYAGPRLGHHIRDSIPPGLVMLCRFVRGRCFVGSISFNENKSRRVILLLQEIESKNSRLFQAFARVDNCCRLKRLDRVGLDPNVNMNQKHFE
jgi:hypothetical protein